MKFLIVVTFVAAIAAVQAASILNEDQKAEGKAYIAECRGEIEISDLEYGQLRAGEHTDASQDAKCFANCFLEKLGVIKDGAFQEAATFKKFSPIIGEENAKQIRDLCAAKKGVDNCDTAYELHTCFVQNNVGLE